MAKKKNSKVDRPRFTLDYCKDGRRYVGRLREVPSVISQGRTLAELKANIIDAYKLVAEEEQATIAVGIHQSRMIGLSL